MIDLHTHSTASDGIFTPTELMKMAHDIGLNAIALSDHDSIDGLMEAQIEADKLGIELVNGVELSLSYRSGSLHMLGYLFDKESQNFIDALKHMKLKRNERNHKIITRFAELGITLSYEELLEAAGGADNAGSIGRPHLAKLLIKKQVVQTFDEAFDKYLGNGKPAYIAKDKITPEAGIKLIHEASGLAVLAHPLYSGTKTKVELEELVSRLAGAGLDGIECNYTDHSLQDYEFYLSLAQKYKLCVTGGSDFHGKGVSKAILGEGTNKMSIDDNLLEKLKAQHKLCFKR